MDLGTAFKYVTDFGPFGVMVVFVFMWQREQGRLRQAYESRIDALMKKYETDMAETRRMYENNVELVKMTQAMAKDLKDVVIMNTQILTRVCEDINTNRFCLL